MSRYPNYLSPDGAPLTKAQKSRARREPSGVFSLFEPAQIRQFKEAFQLIDHDKDGWVNEKDLHEIFASLGIAPTKEMLDELLSARPGDGSRNDSQNGINFTMFLTMMSERLFEFDTEQELVEAFESFDDDDSGTVNVNEMRKWLGEYDRQGNFNYREWVKAIRINDEAEGQ